MVLILLRNKINKVSFRNNHFCLIRTFLLILFYKIFIYYLIASDLQ